MKYNILCISDIHWGVIDAEEQYASLKFVSSFIMTAINNSLKIDLLVIAGDYFDSKLPLNSREAIMSLQWFHEIHKLCIDNGIMLRMFLGTMEHDNDQLESFRSLEDIDGKFKIFNKTTREETLPGLTCFYCPDELLQSEEYIDTYLDTLLKRADIGFFHGSFDIIFNDALLEQLLPKKNVIFKYELMNKLVDGPLISGHWHNGKSYAHLQYCGSPFRFAFNEEEDKGMIFLQYDTEDKSYYMEKIINPLCRIYRTYEIYTNIYTTKDAFLTALDEIRIGVEEVKLGIMGGKVRIVVYLSDDENPNDKLIVDGIRDFISINKGVDIKLTIKKSKKKSEKESSEARETKEKMSFIFDKSASPINIIRDFIISNKEVDVPFDFIEDKYKKYISD